MTRFFYNSDNKKLWLFNNSHNVFYANNKTALKKGFDYYIRGLIDNDTLLLRLYYPYDDIDSLTYKELVKRSDYLLKSEYPHILKVLKENNINIEKTFFSLTNTDIKEKTGLCYV